MKRSNEDSESEPKKSLKLSLQMEILNLNSEESCPSTPLACTDDEDDSISIDSQSDDRKFSESLIKSKRKKKLKSKAAILFRRKNYASSPIANESEDHGDLVEMHKYMNEEFDCFPQELYRRRSTSLASQTSYRVNSPNRLSELKEEEPSTTDFETD